MKPAYTFFLEFLSTLVFVYIVLATGSPIAIGLAYALLLILVQGAVMNPALAIAFAASGNLAVDDLVPTLLAEVVAGLIALEIYKRIKL
jgi:glycerol uptake facilitator-like aquaporin